VEDEAYIQALPRQERSHSDAKLIRQYVAIRERERGRQSLAPSAPVTFRLCRAEEVPPGDTRAAYRAQGLALMRVGND
jgi:hypothetical protein